MLETPDETLRAAGLSRSKVAALKDLAAKTIDGTVPTAGDGKNDHEEIVDRLIQVRGIGRWTVEMLLLFDLGRPDVWPVTRLRGAERFAKIFGKRKLPTPKQMLKHGQRFAPYRSALAWYCWRALDVEKSQKVKRVTEFNVEVLKSPFLTL